MYAFPFVFVGKRFLIIKGKLDFRFGEQKRGIKGVNFASQNRGISSPISTCEGGGIMV